MSLKAMCIAAIYDRTMYVSKSYAYCSISMTGLCMSLKAMRIAAIYDRTVYVSKSYVYCSDL